MVSIMETARQALPIEVLRPLLAQEGRTQQSIADEYGIPYWAVTELKKQYWPYGFDPAEYKEQVSGQADLAPEPEPAAEKPNGEAREESGPPRYTINELIQQHDTAKADLECIDRIHALIKKRSLGVDRILNEHKARCEKQVAMTKRLFERTIIEVPGE